jgi:NAD(P) transhydrogenase subunit beta
MTATDTAVHLVQLAGAACFVIGLHRMRSPATARDGNLLSAGAMAVVLLATGVALVVDNRVPATSWVVGLAGIATGGLVGAYAARTVAMTAVPQLVSVFNAMGGGAAALVAVQDLSSGGSAGGFPAATGGLGVLIGGVTFTGSLVGAGKLQGWVPGRPLVFRGARPVSALLVLGGIAGTGWLVASPGSAVALAGVAVAGLGFGVLLVLPIGGADMPVVISLLNAFTGTAVAMAGFVLGDTALIIAGALVGSSGAILTRLMAAATNRSVPAIVAGGFGTGDAPSGTAGAPGAGQVRRTDVDDAALQLGYAQKVVIVPGYGLAAAQAQHELSELATLLGERGVDVRFAIHPVAGRMPGHMNVLLAEADVPYPQLEDLDEANPRFPATDVALVVGANDVTNPAARRPGNAVSGMPILDVDRARAVIVVKRSLGHGYAGIDNELYTAPNTQMLFGDAKETLSALLAALKALVS